MLLCCGRCKGHFLLNTSLDSLQPAVLLPTLCMCLVSMLPCLSAQASGWYTAILQCEDRVQQKQFSQKAQRTSKLDGRTTSDVYHYEVGDLILHKGRSTQNKEAMFSRLTCRHVGCHGSAPVA